MSRTNWAARRWIAALLATLAALLLGSTGATALSTTPDNGADVTDGRVRAIEQVGDTTVIGGDFGYVGPQTGAGVPFNTSSGAIAARYAQVGGEVDDAEPDGAGGVFIAGSFTSVGGLARSGFAHIDADGTVDADWDPALDPSTIGNSLARVGSTLYVTGNFSEIGGEPRDGFAALDATDGSTTAWNPTFEGGGAGTLETDGTTLYVLGGFTAIGGVPRQYAASFDANGDLTDWDPHPSDNIYQLALGDDVVYVSGGFTKVGGAARQQLAAVDADTGAATAWEPQANTSLNQLVASRSTVYAVGSIQPFGEGESRDIAAIDASSGEILPWAPVADGPVNTVALAGDKLIVGGAFQEIDGQQRLRVAAFDTTDDSLLPWNPAIGGAVAKITVTGDYAYVGGTFSSAGGSLRNHLAALDADGHLLPWSPDPDDTVYTIAQKGSDVVIGGAFSSFAGQSRHGLVAVDATSGALLPWDPDVTGGPVRALEFAGDRLYAGGTFSAVAGEPRPFVAAFDADDGALTPWTAAVAWSGPTRNPILMPPIFDNPLTPGVFALDEHDGIVYAGGLFDSVNGQSRARLVALDADDASVLPWNPGVVGKPIPRGPFGPAPRPGIVFSLAATDSTVYVGGGYVSAGGGSNGTLTGIDTTTGAADPAVPDFASDVLTMRLDGSTLWVAAGRVTSLDTTTNTLGDWSVAPGTENYGVFALSVSGSRVDIGGTFGPFGGSAPSNYARFLDD